MYHFFVNQDQIGESEIVILGADVNHMKNVLRMKAGEKLWISNGIDKDYFCEIDQLYKDQVIAKIISAEEGRGELPVKLYLFQGLPKADKLELIIQKAVELGVYKIIPVVTKRTVVKLDRKKEEARLKRWQSVSESAAKQSGRLIIPTVSPVMTFKEALAFSGRLHKRLIPYERAEGMERTREILSEIKSPMSVGIFIGPEGGFEDTEAEQAKEAGAEEITLGNRILRTETAGLAILSVLAYLTER